MTNSEKFTTAMARTKAFNKACKGACNECKIFEAKDRQHTVNCPFVWLEMEADEEVLLPCPFCDGTATLCTDGTPYIWCNDCGIETIAYQSPDEAIAAWNRRV